MPYLIDKLVGATPAFIIALVCSILGVWFLFSGCTHEREDLQRAGTGVAIFLAFIAVGGAALGSLRTVPTANPVATPGTKVGAKDGPMSQPPAVISSNLNECNPKKEDVDALLKANTSKVHLESEAQDTITRLNGGWKKFEDEDQKLSLMEDSSRGARRTSFDKERENLRLQLALENKERLKRALFLRGELMQRFGPSDNVSALDSAIAKYADMEDIIHHN